MCSNSCFPHYKCHICLLWQILLLCYHVGHLQDRVVQLCHLKWDKLTVLQLAGLAPRAWMTTVSLIRSFFAHKFSGFCSNNSLVWEMFQMMFTTGIIVCKWMGLRVLQRDKRQGACVKLLLLLWDTNKSFFFFSVLFRASGTVYTAIDVATGQEVSAARVPQQWILDCVLKVQVDATK